MIPGVTVVQRGGGRAGTPLVRRDDVFTILPGTLSGEVLAARLRSAATRRS